MRKWDFWPKKRQAHYGTLAQYDMWYFGTNEFRVVIRGKGTKESPLSYDAEKNFKLIGSFDTLAAAQAAVEASHQSERSKR
jgi:hypothetical protein